MKEKRSFLKKLSFPMFAMVIILFFESFTPFDLWLQDLFFNRQTGQWFISKVFHEQWGFLLYTLPKTFLIIFAALNIGAYIYSRKTGAFLQWRKNFLKIFLALALIPSCVGILKDITNVYCPYQIQRYNGANPYAPALRKYPANFVQISRGAGFPAGHASGGLALMVLYFCFAEEKKRRIARALALGLGWYMGIYQMLRGEHFLSHTLFVTALAWSILLLINRLVEQPDVLAKLRINMNKKHLLGH